MNRVIGRRFTRGLFSCFLLLVMFVLGYSPGGTAVPAFAAGDPVPIDKNESSKDGSASPNELTHTTEAVIPDQVLKESPEKSITTVTPPAPRMDPDKDVVIPFDLNPELETVEFQATAYCLKGRTASGVNTRPGVIAADPRVLPLGTVVHIRAGRYTGTYTVLDTGGRIKGHTIDIFLADYVEARRFGRQRIKVKVLSRGGRRPQAVAPPATSLAKAQ